MLRGRFQSPPDPAILMFVRMFSFVPGHLRRPRVAIQNMTGAALILSCGLVSLSPAAPVSFARDVRPILSDKCFKCHGPDAQNRAADLRLDVGDEAEHVLADGEDSELIYRITSDDRADMMPPPSSKLSLTAREIEILTQWVKQGATYERHWSFQPLSTVTPPTLQDEAWSQNEIDRFILARLLEEDLSPSPPAAKHQLLRRVTFDLTGLPPTPEEVRAFLADDSAEAYEKVVDRLLASDAYGERMAADWMDVAPVQ
jgi:hypothetical protein